MHDHFRDAPQVQPLRREVVHERGGRARIGEHAAHLLFEDRRLGELAALGEIEQPLVGNAAPEEERQPRCQLDVAQTAGRCRRRTCIGRRIVLNAQQEIRVDQDPLERELNARIEAAAVAAAALEELQDRVEVGFRDRPPVGQPRHPRKDLCVGA